MSFIKELKRRNVFKVAIAYVIVSWLVVQVIDSIVPIIEAPEWAAKVVLVLLLAGFPIACLFAWAFELTAEGIKRSKDVDIADSISHQTSRKIDFIIIAALLFIIGGLLYQQYFSTPVNTTINSSIAVLPFRNISSDPEQEYFSDGIAEEILNALVRVKGLSVSSRTSSFVFKGSGKSIKEIAKALRVNHVLEGSVRKYGNKVKITTQLIDVSNDKYVWSNTFERELNDIFAIQEEISLAIVSSLKLSLDPLHSQQSQTTNIQAYSIYLQGKFEYAKRSSDSLALFDAISLFEQAIELDPGYANAYASMGRAHAMLLNYGLVTDLKKHHLLARTAINMALALDAKNVEALLSLATVKFQWEGDFIGAQQDFQSAIALSPQNAEIYNFFGDYFNTIMDYDNALIMEGMAFELDPNSYINVAEYGQTLLRAGQVDQGLELLRELFTAKAEFVNSNQITALGNYFARRLIATKLGGQKLIAQGLLKSRFSDLLLKAYSGDEQALTTLINTPVFGYTYADIYPIFIADIYFQTGKFDQAELWLQKTLDKGVNYFEFIDIKVADPRVKVNHAGINKLLNSPPLDKFMRLRRKNLGL
ncbi:tetratricopeptide repeat protein [Thalassotalea sp. ND16A]|uniref:tetratricopeptide repeat protein n=1 Tax=Thalassotalea sp. ND16A TaxID=1535422 RepID=UPI00051DAD97|nr:hypothetical protein [Thalassotalea sp. ND16A]KGJ90481.1 Adenylate cyclase [Thalassotalea sp. ND16A]